MLVWHIVCVFCGVDGAVNGAYLLHAPRRQPGPSRSRVSRGFFFASSDTPAATAHPPQPVHDRALLGKG